jgi:glutamate/tyrosine decarboxylase-like PLP-dependent enzyme
MERPILDAELLERAARHASAYLAGVEERPVGPPVDADALRRALDTGLSEDGVPAANVIDELVAAADPGVVASAGPRYFGFVTGGALPVALAADWLAAAWDQQAGLYVSGPAAAVAEEVAGAWLLELLGLPRHAAVGFATGAQMANTTCLAAARHAVLERAGWDVAAQGLQGAPRVTVLVGEEVHATVPAALRLLGLGMETARRVAVDAMGAMDPGALGDELADVEGPAIVCAQAGNVNTGAIDPLEPIAAACERAGAWLHVDGAFGLWAAASERRRHLAAGAERADSWACDGHKWLNVPYDSGFAIVSDPAAQRAAMAVVAAYLVASGHREPEEYVPEASRRARGFAVYAALRQLGRRGVAALVDRCCDHAAEFARVLRAEPGIEILNDVTLNQVLVAFGDDSLTDGGRRRPLGGGDRQGSAPMRRVSRSRNAGASTSSATWAFGSRPVRRQRSTSVRPRDGPGPVSTSTCRCSMVSRRGSITCATAIASCTGVPSKP